MLHNLIGITGKFGSGKTLYALEWGVSLANRFEKNLIVNFSINEPALRAYCRAMGFRWFAANGRIFRIDVTHDLMTLWERPGRGGGKLLNRDCVIVFDEAGVFSNARAWSTMPKDFLKYLNQLRRINVHLLIVFQFQEQVDRQFRMLMQRWCVCRATGFYDKKLQAPRILARVVYHYSPEIFFKLEDNVRAKANIFLPWIWADMVYWRLFAINQAVHHLRLLVWRGLALVGRSYPRPFQRESLLFEIFNSKELLGAPIAPARRAPYLGLSAADFQSQTALRNAINDLEKLYENSGSSWPFTN